MNADRDRLAAAKKRLRDYLDEVDAQTRRPGEKPLRQAVAEQARTRLNEMDADDLTAGSEANR